MGRVLLVGLDRILLIFLNLHCRLVVIGAGAASGT